MDQKGLKPNQERPKISQYKKSILKSNWPWSLQEHSAPASAAAMILLILEPNVCDELASIRSQDPNDFSDSETRGLV